MQSIRLKIHEHRNYGPHHSRYDVGGASPFKRRWLAAIRYGVPAASGRMIPYPTAHKVDARHTLAGLLASQFRSAQNLRPRAQYPLKHRGPIPQLY